MDAVCAARKFKPEVVEAIRAFRATKPWRGTLQERFEKFKQLHKALCGAYGMTTTLKASWQEDGSSGASYYDPSSNTLVLTGKLSVVTYLHEFRHAIQHRSHGAAQFPQPELDACAWSLSLFARFFPLSFSRCTFDGHTLVKREVTS
jgi:hypothetical protein